MLTYFNSCVLKATRSLRQTDSKQVVLVQDIPSLFHDPELFRGLSDKEIVMITLLPHADSNNKSTCRKIARRKIGSSVAENSPPREKNDP